MSDEAARRRIREDLDTNLLVEAGAGSGKTTCLVERMVNLIRRGEPVERIAAVTFTRKAANELRERFQLGLEAARREADGTEDADRLDLALRDLDASFLGTIHAFCGRLLRERALEAGLDPTFEEVDQEGLALLRDDFFGRWLERGRLSADPTLHQLEALRIEPRELAAAFGRVVDNPDVIFPLEGVPRPDHVACRRSLLRLLSEADRLMPAAEPDDGWDELMKLIRRLRYRARLDDWADLGAFCSAIETLRPNHCKVVQKRWAEDKAAKAAAKDLADGFLEFVEGEADQLLTRWREHRYAPVMEFLQRAASAFERERRRTGRLGFQDLLMLAASLLRSRPAARTALGERFRRLLVDEFQDTDPIQAEVCLLLSSEPGEGDDWRTVRPRAGALFVVGDPKQSIYRFRRADLETYGFVRERMGLVGAVLRLTRNFRSTGPIERFVNGYTGEVFPEEATRYQAPFAPMQTVMEAGSGDGGFHYSVTWARAKAEVLADDAGRVSSWISAEIGSGRRTAGDFLVLVQEKRSITPFAAALAERNVPVSTTGARLPQERELTELRLLLETLADPGNPLLVGATLEGLFFGLSPADLYAASSEGIALSALQPPDGTGPVADALTRLVRWRAWATRDSADLLLERLLDETGLLPYAASQPLGDGRAGTLLRLVETVRDAAQHGASALSDGVAAIDRALELDASATLRPGRGDAVRVMNLHQAKGLEAPVVILAAPLDRTEHEPEIHVSRSTDGAEGGIAVHDTAGGLLAHPPDWRMMQAEEALFLAAELDRLRYVAATRPQHQLLVARLEKDGVPKDDSIWSAYAAQLESHSASLALPLSPAPGRPTLRRSVEAIQQEVAAGRVRLSAAAVAGFEQRSVTRSTRSEAFEREGYDLPRAAEPGGRSWGTAVHRGIEASGRGRSGASLRRFLAAVLREEFPDDDTERTAQRVTALELLLEQVAQLPEWRDRVGLELGIMRVEDDGGTERITEGVIDLLARSDGQCQVVDWKTDRGNDATWATRLPKYEAQVAAYTGMLRTLGQPMRDGRIQRLREP